MKNKESPSLIETGTLKEMVLASYIHFFVYSLSTLEYPLNSRTWFCVGTFLNKQNTSALRGKAQVWV